MESLKYINMYEEQEIYLWNNSTNVYFRHMPYSVDFMILIMMGFLRGINHLYYTEDDEQSGFNKFDAEKIYQRAETLFMEKYNTAYTIL